MATEDDVRKRFALRPQEVIAKLGKLRDMLRLAIEHEPRAHGTKRPPAQTRKADNDDAPKGRRR